MTSFVALLSLYLCVIVFETRVSSITTKSLPSISTNHSDSSKFVQIRSAFNQPVVAVRPYSHQHKNSLSPVQQTHILDDVQKNQRIHYAPTAGHDQRQKSLFGGGHHSHASSSPHKLYPPPQFPNLNSLSPPPLQTVVLSPQQTLPTTSTNFDHVPFFRAFAQSPSSSLPHHENAFESFKVPYQSSPRNYNVLSPVRSSPPVSVPQYPFYYPETIASTVTVPTKSTAAAAPSQYHNSGTKDSNKFFVPLVAAAAAADKPKLTAGVAQPDKIIKEIVIRANPEELIAKDRQKFFQQLLDDKTPEEAFDGGENDNDDQTVAQNDLGGIRGQFEKELLRQIKEGVITGPMTDFGMLVNASNAVSEFSLPNGQKIQISKDYNRLLENDDSEGTNKIKAIVVKQPPSSATVTVGTPAGGPNILEELTKGVVPPGAEVEVIKRNQDGALEEVAKLPPNIPQKKVTFVILEEQSDGTVKVQGVRGSEKESLRESGEEVETIIKKIKDGELKLPPSTRLSPVQSSQKPSKNGNRASDAVFDHKSKRKSSDASNNNYRPVKRKEQDVKHFVPTPPTINAAESSYYQSTSGSTVSRPYFSPDAGDTVDVKYLSNDLTSSTPFDEFTSSADSSRWTIGKSTGTQPPSDYTAYEPTASSSTVPSDLGLFHLNNSGYIANLFSALKNPSSIRFTAINTDGSQILQYPYLPSTSGSNTVADAKLVQNLTDDYAASSTAILSTAAAAAGRGTSSINSGNAPSPATTANAHSNKTSSTNWIKSKRDRNGGRKTTKKPVKEIRKDTEEEESNVEETKSEEPTPSTVSSTDTTSTNFTLSDILKKEGFFAMARFLRQSGLDSILNDTGPFTLFIPTDKAFRTLLIQLGGPDKAEEKFKENPRLLSGLLLHHVIPGAFRVNTLQDEMTGVSLAGTQLRVNTYTTHDIEWNDITVVTVNGAKILDEKDIVIPQGIAHALDRVMFPLPVGNLQQSLQADRENRYSNFLKVIEESELSYLLTGAKTYTLFAPLNRAFTHADFTRIITDKNESKSFVLRHLVPGALYSAGMKYYQVRDSLEDGQQVTLYKEAGKIKVNSAHVITRNIPATNGVIHAIDAAL